MKYFLCICWVLGFTVQKGSAQTLPATIDLSSAFYSINEYNQLIRSANNDHFYRSQELGKKYALFGATVLLIGSAGYIEFGDGFGIPDSIGMYVSPALLGVGLATGYLLFEETNQYDLLLSEQEKIRLAKELFPHVAIRGE